MTEAVLVIGYGNELRRDDGAGPLVARAVAARGWPGVRALAVHQLTPELAEPLAAADIAVFIDAAASGAAVSARPVIALARSSTAGHTSDPAWVLGLAQAAYGRLPTAWLVTVPATDVGHGRELSPTTRNGVREALRLVGRLAQRG